ncbi:MAG: hypothetical protein HC906_01565 [Bacteroidales bacterium]|nr:hypothetical protein [Bacteroidales bacterium]
MLQSAKVLQYLYPNEFSENDLNDHVKELLIRFQNRALGDTVFRVGYDLPRKLGREDRLFAPIILAYTNNLAFDKILFAAVCGFFLMLKMRKEITILLMKW